MMITHEWNNKHSSKIEQHTHNKNNKSKRRYTESAGWGARGRQNQNPNRAYVHAQSPAQRWEDTYNKPSSSRERSVSKSS